VINRPIKIGTRASKLALWQAHYVADLLKQSGMDSEIVLIDTKGDQVMEVSIAKIGSKGVFTQELEEQLLDGRIDIAVHSAKDMPSILPDGLALVAFTQREQAHDVLVSRKGGISLSNTNAPLLLGTSSTRRVASLKHFYPHVQTVDVRGNLQTRIRKMEEGLCDALVLAYAGVYRMGYGELVVADLALDEFTPAVGQGSVAIELATRLDQSLQQAIIAACNHLETEVCLRAERAYLRVLEGGCSIPVFALAQLSKGILQINGGIVSLDGKERISLEVFGPMEQAEELGEQLAREVLDAGGKKILADIKQTPH
jgi:hydroxymethylbilane synthase